MSDNTVDFLAEIYRGVKMGNETIKTILPKVKDNEMKQELLREQSIYQQFEQKALDELSKRNEKPQPISKAQSVGSWLGVQMNTIIDSTSSHIADLMIQGNNMGIIGITKIKNSHENAESQVVNLADELINIQQQNIEKLKPFL